MTAFARVGHISGILCLLACAAPASAEPAQEYQLDMAVVVHPDVEPRSPPDVKARVEAVLEQATRILEGIDAFPASETSCPVRFRASNIRRYEHTPRPPYRCGTGFAHEVALFPESVLGEASGCADAIGQGIGMFVGAGFYRNPDDAGATYAHEMGHLAGVPGDHQGWDGTLLAGGGLRTRTVPPRLCQIYIDYAQRRGAERGVAACISGSGLPPGPDPYTPDARFSACDGRDGWCDGSGRCIDAPAACVDGHALPARGADCSAAGRCRSCTGSRSECVPCTTQIETDARLPGLLLVESSAHGNRDLLYRSTPRAGSPSLSELDRFLDFGAQITGLARDPGDGTLYLVSPEPASGDRLFRVSADGAVQLVAPLGTTRIASLTFAADERLLYGLVADPAAPDRVELIAIDPATARVLRSVRIADAVRSLAFDASRSALLTIPVDPRSGRLASETLAAVDRETGALALETHPYVRASALAYDPVGQRIFVADTSAGNQNIAIRGLEGEPDVLVGPYPNLRVDHFVTTPICGDRAVDPGEQCDDGNFYDGDGCSALCRASAIDPAGSEDRDGDGVPGFADGCPAIADASQADRDGDGAGDACDLCPSVRDPEQRDRDRDGRGDLCDAAPDDPASDSDNDGLADAADSCPAVSNVVPTYSYTAPDVRDGDRDGLRRRLRQLRRARQPRADRRRSRRRRRRVRQLRRARTRIRPTPTATPSATRATTAPPRANPDQRESDGDGRADACDNCPALAERQPGGRGSRRRRGSRATTAAPRRIRIRRTATATESATAATTTTTGTASPTTAIARDRRPMRRAPRAQLAAATTTARGSPTPTSATAIATGSATSATTALPSRTCRRRTSSPDSRQTSITTASATRATTACSRANPRYDLDDSANQTRHGDYLFRTTTGEQLDDDSDGLGNACDGDHNGDGVADIDDWSWIEAEFGKDLDADTCNSFTTSDCDVFDLDGAGTVVSSADVPLLTFAVTCPDCPLACAGEMCDDDGDERLNRSDNCARVANPSQCDTDQDGYGNLCDPDFDQNGRVEAARLRPPSRARSARRQGQRPRHRHELRRCGERRRLPRPASAVQARRHDARPVRAALRGHGPVPGSVPGPICDNDGDGLDRARGRLHAGRERAPVRRGSRRLRQRVRRRLRPERPRRHRAISMAGSRPTAPRDATAGAAPT